MVAQQDSMGCSAQGGSRRFGLAAALLAVALGACGRLVQMDEPSPDGPAISALAFVPEEVAVRCPVRVRFHFDAPLREIVRARAGWVRAVGRTRESGYVVLPVAPAMLAGKTSGEVEAPIGFERPGSYSYYVQVEDDAGWRSNVLSGQIVVKGQWGSGAPGCSSWSAPAESRLP